MKNKKLKKGAAIITGASRGIGAEIARKLSKDGFPVVINYLKSKDKAESVLKEIKNKGGDGIVCQADVTEDTQVKKMFAKAEEIFGDIEVLINNAGGSIINNSFKELTWENIETQMNVQLKGSFNTCKHAIPLMENIGRGKIVNITSIYTDSTPPIKTYDYTIAKAALSSFTKSLATEYGPKGIKINNVAPGMTETSLIGDIPERTKMVTQMQTPLRRLATVDDIANVVSALVGEAGDYITGETIRVSGGQKMI
jgi:3-oxoacyl-[acyl-carrier protein] reductase